MEHLSQQALSDPSGVVRLIRDRYELVIGDVFIALRGSPEPIGSGQVDARSRTTLRRLKCETWGHLTSHSIGDIWTVPNAGELTVTRILLAAAQHNVDEANNPGRSLVWEEQASATDGTTVRPELERLDRVLSALAAWAQRERGASSLSDVIGLAGSLERVPPEISAEFDLLLHLPLAGFATSAEGGLPSDLLEQLLDAIGTGTEIALARRVRLGTRPTLEELGQGLGVTRERVRQLESRALASAAAAVRSPQFSSLRWRASDLADALGAAVLESSDVAIAALLRATRDLTRPSSCSAAELMLWMAGPYSREGSWLVAPGSTLEALTRSFNAAAGGSTILTKAAALTALDGINVHPEMLGAFLHECQSWRQVDGDTFVLWTGSAADKACAILELVGEPQSLGEINDHIGEGHSLGYLRNALAVDDRFVRLDRESNFGLREWGLEEYSGIAQEMLERIERGGGYVDLEELVAELVSQFGVSANSVRMYAGSPAFLVENGVLVERPPHNPYVANSQLDRVRGLYRGMDGSVIVHDIVDKDVLRGSGRRFPEPAAAALRIQPGDRLEFRFSPNVRVVVSWPATSVMGPSLGSVKHIAEGLGLAAGQDFRLRFDRTTMSCSAAPVEPGSIEGLTGVPVRDGFEIQDLAKSIEVEPSVLRSRLQARGDDAVLALLKPTRITSDLGDAISTFGDLLAD